MYRAHRAITTLLLLSFGLFSAVGPHWHSHSPANNCCRSESDDSAHCSSSDCSSSDCSSRVSHSSVPRCCTPFDDQSSCVIESSAHDKNSLPSEHGATDLSQPGPSHDDDCSICRFYTTIVDGAVYFQIDWDLPFVVGEAPATETRVSIFASVFDARGPPSFVA